MLQYTAFFFFFSLLNAVFVYNLFFDLTLHLLLPFIFKVGILLYISTFPSAITHIKGLDRIENYQYFKSGFTAQTKVFIFNK